MAYTPMIEQYLQIKREYRDAILFFRLGDFYEMFFEDAVLASRELEITLTGREAGVMGRVPMCGVPWHSSNSYVARLIEKGYKVAICEQVEDPRETKGIVRREVTRVITPGTIMDVQALDEKRNNFLMAVFPGENGCGVAAADVSTGLFIAVQYDGCDYDDFLLEEATRLRPAEVLFPEGIKHELSGRVRAAVSTIVTPVKAEAFNRENALRMIRNQLGPGWNQTGLGERPLAVFAAGALIAYLKETQKCDVAQLNRVQIYSAGQYMVLDVPTRRNLELTRSLRDGSVWGTLLWVLDHTVTSMGGRLLKLWIEQPLLDIGEINNRLDAVGELNDNVFFRNDIRRLLHEIYDLERLSARVAYGTANARDLKACAASLAVLPRLKKLLRECLAPLLREIAEDIFCLEELRDLIDRAIIADPPVSIREGGLIRQGYNPEVDRLRSVSRNGKKWLAEMEARERERTGIKSLKVGFNKVFGYYIEITRANLDMVPPEYIRKQTLANAERFITPELKRLEEEIIGAEDRLVQLEYQLFTEIREKAAAEVPQLQRTAGAIARVDVILSFSEAAVRGGYVRPEIDDGNCLKVAGGRHPVVERVLGAGRFVPNDIFLDSQARLIILTGPNMAGKSTFLRQVALLVLMSQVGSYIPAEEARIGLVDRIFTRIGAADDLAAGQSTFMVEMNECQVIVKNATTRSLIIMDEVGRGTSTYDGMSIARALIEYISMKIGARTLFSTHYHELTDLEKLPDVRNYTMAVKEEGDEVVFLHRVLPGKSDRSYGIHVARLAGIPEDILARAKEILSGLENGREVAVSVGPCGSSGKVVSYPVCPVETTLRNELVSLNIAAITPLDALNWLAQWQKLLKINDA